MPHHSPPEPLRVGVIGAGNWARMFHCSMYAQHGRARVVAVHDHHHETARSFAREQSARFGSEIRVAQTIDELLDHCEAVSIVTPERFHAQPTIAALQRGVHVLCEKPLTSTLDEAKRVARDARDAQTRGVVARIDFTKRDNPAMRRAVRLAASGALGPLRHLAARYHQAWLASDVWGHWHAPNWLWRLESEPDRPHAGGVLGDLGCHVIDWSAATAGPITSLKCSLHTFEKLRPGRPPSFTHDGKDLRANDTAIIEARFASGAVGVLEMTRWATGRPNAESLELFGAEGALRWNNEPRGFLETCLADDRHAPAWKRAPVPDQRAVIHTFADDALVALGRAEPDPAERPDPDPAAPSLLEGALVQAALDACERSARTGEWTDVLTTDELLADPA